ncbi:nucleoside triphosphate pyrophosphohydrolase family protein [Xanthomonas sp. MUS 060]|uniref:nucleoside triphosphate pyrophosphohydrolase family protein n=1 Tax=Xanthomonas sp. MUS 060 TaxID=1588031 RepID=UPI0005F2E2CF|nr:nucleoside triphosphate pyrophosphohydrolase family protein [Xanthomonas sp. MUS 060]
MTPALPQPLPLSLPQYLLQSRLTNRFENSPEEFDNLRFGYFGETGGLLAAIKKSGRDKLTETQSALAAEELGDALWYLISTAHLLGISADDLGEQCIRRLRQRFKDNDRPAVIPVSFRQIDALLDTYKEGWEVNRITK